MKKLVLGLTVLVSFSAFSQKVAISESEERVDEMKRKGLLTILEIDEDVVKTAWTKKLREFGSYKTKTGSYVVEQGTIGTISPSYVKIISKIEPTTKGTRIWYAIDLGDSYVTSDGEKSKYNEAVRILHDFGVALYIQDINEQIKEAEKVLINSVRDQERMMAKAEIIRSSIARNRQEKIRLDLKMADISLEYKQLTADSVQNTKNQAAAAENVEKMKRSVDAVRAKISRVE